MLEIDLRPEHLQAVQDLIRKYLPGIAVWAYGSRVNMTARDNSDLDLVAFTASSTAAAVSALRDAFDESNIPFLIDLHVWNEIPVNFHDQIQRRYVEIQPVE
jgi:predicted nucleotidyltransferase